MFTGWSSFTFIGDLWTKGAQNIALMGSSIPWSCIWFTTKFILATSLQRPTILSAIRSLRFSSRYSTVNALINLLCHVKVLHITHANDNTHVDIKTFAVRDMLPDVDHLDFYRYDGSLTTPPCSESVIWSVAVENIEISENQLNQFRNLSDDNYARLVNDFRPIQPEHNRLITT
ncbi:unnamed protein product, partial [Lymnaea stagnalis]